MANVKNPNRTCPECGTPFVATHGRQMFCCGPHQRRFHERNGSRGTVLLPLLLAWRQGKRGASDNSTYAFKELCSLADAWGEEDRAAGRNAVTLVEQKRVMAWRAGDLPSQKNG